MSRLVARLSSIDIADQLNFDHMRFTRALAIALSLLCVYGINEYRLSCETAQQLAQRIRSVNQTAELIKAHTPYFKQVFSHKFGINNVRVRWAEAVYNKLQRPDLIELDFVIEDAVQSELHYPEFSELFHLAETKIDTLKINQYPVTVTGAVDNDAVIFALLDTLGRFPGGMFLHRGCQIKRVPTHDSLSINCLFTVYDLETMSKGA